MAGPVPPHDHHAEARIIASVLVYPARLLHAADALAPEDFHRPAHGVMWAEIVRQWREGGEVSIPTVADALRRRDISEDAVVELLAATPSGPIDESLRIVGELAHRRRLLTAIGAVTGGLYGGEPLDEAVTVLRRAVDDISAAVGALPSEAIGSDSLLEVFDVDETAPWVVPGQLRQSDRAMVVAAEGIGKMVLLRQMAACVAQGVHPFAPGHPIEPLNTLVIDAENPDAAIMETFTVLQKNLRRWKGVDYRHNACWLYRRPGGINLRSRVTRSHLEKVLRHVRPSLVCAGPVYKLFVARPGESDEQAASDAQLILDDLRTRYGFALVLEHHAAKGNGSSDAKRDLRPMGSSLWLRWPEFGLTLVPRTAAGDHVDVKRFRRHRVKVWWPDELTWSTDVPWLARWNEPVWDGAVPAWDREPDPIGF